MQFALNAIKYEDIRSNIVEFIKNYSETSAEFNYEGSNISMLMDTLAYTDMLLSYQLSLTANNIFLDTTNLRKNAVSIAKTLGYRPQRKKPAIIIGNIIFKGSNFSKNSYIIIPPLTKFYASDKNLPFINTDAIKLSFVDSETLSGSFILTQGEIKRYTTFGTGTPLQSFVIPSTNVAEGYLDIYVKSTSSEDYTKEKWKEVKTFFEITNENIYFVEEDIQTEFVPKIIFGTGVIGRIPSNKETIIAEYLETVGAAGNGASEIQFDNDETLSGVLSSSDIVNPVVSQFEILIDENVVSYGGRDNETLEDIKANASKFFSAVGRGVTANDYATIMTNYKSLLSFNVAGADELFSESLRQNLLGNIFITAIPFLDYNHFPMNNQFYLTETQEAKIVADMFHLGIVSTQRTFMKPTFLLIENKPSIEVRPNASESEISTVFEDSLNNLYTYYEKNFSQVGKRFRASKVLSVLDSTQGVVSSSLDLTFNFMLNYDSIYRDKDTILFLPVIFKRDADGNTIYDEHYIPTKTNFLKKNTTIVDEENLLDENNYTVYTLPPEDSSIFGHLTHRNLDRIIYNRDVIKYPIVKIHNINGILEFEYTQFFDNKGNTMNPVLIESGEANKWNLVINSTVSGTIIRNSDNTYQIVTTPTQEAYLKSLGVNLPGRFENVHSSLNEATEDYIQLVFDVSNIISDIRLKGDCTLGKIVTDSDGSLVLENPKDLFDTDLNKFTIQLVKPSSDESFYTLSAGEIELCKLNPDTFTFYDYTDNFLQFSLQKYLTLDSDNNIIALDVANEISIGRLNYITGEAVLKKLVDIIISPTEFKTVTLKEVFNNYTSTNKYDIIRLKSDNYIDSNGVQNGLLSDFDPVFNQLIVPIIANPIIKKG